MDRRYVLQLLLLEQKEVEPLLFTKVTLLTETKVGRGQQLIYLIIVVSYLISLFC